MFEAVNPPALFHRFAALPTPQIVFEDAPESTQTIYPGPAFPKSLLQKVPEGGLEPPRPCGHWILNPELASRKDRPEETLSQESAGVVPTVVPSSPNKASQPGIGPLPEHVQGDSELALVIQAWPNLPRPVKAGILAMVQAAQEADR